MNCAVHTDQPATGYCRNCGKAMCPQCTREVRSSLYCEECLGKLLAAPAATYSPGAELPPGVIPPAPPPPGSPNPTAAAVLGLIPGLGAVYNGQYLKALIHVVIFAGLISAIAADWPSAGYYAFFAISLACFYFYMPIEAFHVARARREGVSEPGSLVPDSYAGSRPIGAFILIGIGVLFLLGNFGLLQTEWISKSWPAALVVLGIYLLWNRTRRSA